jgi:hypothetical protein
VDWLSIGIGVNLVAAPPVAGETDFPPVSLADHGDRVAPDSFLAALASHFATQEAILEAARLPRCARGLAATGGETGRDHHGPHLEGGDHRRFDTVDEAAPRARDRRRAAHHRGGGCLFLGRAAMLLCIDCGNTNTVFSIWDGESFLATWRIATDHKRTADEYFVWLSSLMMLTQGPLWR